jgi:sugar phosphate isomerase/epimerase
MNDDREEVASGARILAVLDEPEMRVVKELLEETVRRLEDTGIRVLAVEVVRIGPDTKQEHYERVLEAGARLGARYVTVNSDDPEIERASDTFAALTADARPYGLRPLIEPIYIAERSGGGGNLLDALHFRRYGGRLEQLCSVNPQLLSYAQLCDAPLASVVPATRAHPDRRKGERDGG